jgi:hypothetical protein
MRHSVRWRAGLALVAGIGIAGAAVSGLDAFREAQRAYQNESQLATVACATRLAKAGRRLVEAYDRAVETAKLNGDAARMKSLQEERTQALAIVERLEKEGIRDPLSEFLSVLSGRTMRTDLPHDGMVAYFGFNEGFGKITLEALSKEPVAFGAAEWAKEDGEPVLDFRKPAAVLTTAGIALGPAWSIVLRAKFPLEMEQHTWASLLVGGVGRHHVLVSRSGEIGVFKDSFVASGATVKDLNGWHTLVARAADQKTSFWIDGVLRGTANALVTEAIQTIGNGPWSANGDFQNFGVVMDGFVVFNRALKDEEIVAIGSRRL